MSLKEPLGQRGNQADRYKDNKNQGKRVESEG